MSGFEPADPVGPKRGAADADRHPALITFVNYARARGGAEAAAGRFSFCESGWRRSGSVRRRRRAQRATGSTSPPAACTGKLMVSRVDHSL